MRQAAGAAGRMPVVVCTRFSFHGLSGWKSGFSTDPGLLYAPERVAARLRLFRAITLASLAAQEDQGFHHWVLTGEALPAPARAELEAACLAAYGDPARFTVEARPYGRARAWLQAFLATRHAGRPVAQVVLDDDDGLARGFMTDLRGRLERIAGEAARGERALPHFVSYPFGVALVTGTEDARGGAALYRHSYTYINLGLTLVGPPEARNVLAVDHLAAPRRFGAEISERKFMFLRSVHGLNDSRVGVSHRWVRIDDWRDNARLAEAMPWLGDAVAAVTAPG